MGRTAGDILRSEDFSTGGLQFGLRAGREPAARRAGSEILSEPNGRPSPNGLLFCLLSRADVIQSTVRKNRCEPINGNEKQCHTRLLPPAA